MADIKICVFSGGSLYRLPIYNRMADALNCDFYLDREDPDKGIVTYNTNGLTNYRKTLIPHRLVGGFYWLKGVLSLFNEPYDLYIVGGPFCLSYWFLIFFSKFSKKKIASWSHGIYGREKGIRLLIKTLYYKLCDINFVYNDRAVQLMKTEGIDTLKIVSVGNALDSDNDLLIREKLVENRFYNELFNNSHPVLIFVGRVTNEKRLDMIIESMKMLKDKDIYVNLFVVGKDIDGVNLMDAATAKGVSENVYLYGPCYDNEKLGNFFYNADLCVSPGNVGLTAISAMTFGCPVISHNNFNYQGPEFEAIKPGITGDFFSQGDINELTKVIEKWLFEIINVDRDSVRKNTYKEVDSRWNIYSEVEKFQKAISNLFN